MNIIDPYNLKLTCKLSDGELISGNFMSIDIFNSKSNNNRYYSRDLLTEIANKYNDKNPNIIGEWWWMKGNKKMISPDAFVIENVKFSGYKVIVFWKDKTKTIVTLGDDENNDDVEKALFAAFTKKVLSFMKNAKGRSINDMIDKWTKKYKDEEQDILIQQMKINNRLNEKRLGEGKK